MAYDPNKLTDDQRRALEEYTAQQLDEAKIYLPGAPPSFVMGRSEGHLVFDNNHQAHLDFASGGAIEIHGHGMVRPIMASQNYTADYGECVNSWRIEYAKALSQRFPPDDEGNPRQVLVLASREEAISLCGPSLLELIGADCHLRDGGEVQDAVHQARGQGQLIVTDEYETGFGRTGTFVLSERFGFVPDVVILGPAGAAGWPFCAVVAPRSFFASMAPHPYAASPAVCGVALTVLDYITVPLMDHVTIVGQALRVKIAELSKEYPQVQGVTGVGLLQKLQLRDPTMAERFRRGCREKGLLIGGDLKLTPPLSITAPEIGAAVAIMAAELMEWE